MNQLEHLPVAGEEKIVVLNLVHANQEPLEGSRNGLAIITS